MTGLRLRGGAACFLLRDCLAVLLTTHCPLVATAQHSPDIAQNNQGELPGAGLETHALLPPLTEQRTCEEIAGQSGGRRREGLSPETRQYLLTWNIIVTSSNWSKIYLERERERERERDVEVRCSDVLSSRLRKLLFCLLYLKISYCQSIRF